MTRKMTMVIVASWLTVAPAIASAVDLRIGLQEDPDALDPASLIVEPTRRRHVPDGTSDWRIGELHSLHDGSRDRRRGSGLWCESAGGRLDLDRVNGRRESTAAKNVPRS